jgi:hypothetical protein
MPGTFRLGKGIRICLHRDLRGSTVERKVEQRKARNGHCQFGFLGDLRPYAWESGDSKKEAEKPTGSKLQCGWHRTLHNHNDLRCLVDPIWGVMYTGPGSTAADVGCQEQLFLSTIYKLKIKADKSHGSPSEFVQAKFSHSKLWSGPSSGHQLLTVAKSDLEFF